MEPFDGYRVFTLPGLTLETSQLVDTLREVATQLGLADQFAITVGSNEVPFICELEFAPFLEQFPKAPRTALSDALKRSVEVFLDQASRGWLTRDNVA